LIFYFLIVNLDVPCVLPAMHGFDLIFKIVDRNGDVN